ncbi:MAG TPA: hypothetical protein VK866_14520 [Acidimicrobiales bacterium]|nr:hypothetical protein [Acidimicrobiales bacterium]
MSSAPRRGTFVTDAVTPGENVIRNISQVVRRRWWVLVLAPVIAANLALLLTGEPDTDYRAEAVVLVPSGPARRGPVGRRRPDGSRRSTPISSR